jgi:hypothetical protein
MIRFDFDWSGPLNQLIIALLVMLLALQIWLLIKNKNIQNETSAASFGIRLALNILLWVSIAAFILQPCIIQKSVSKKGILTGGELPANIVQKWADSLSNAELVSPNDLAEPHFDSLIIVGQEFNSAQIQRIAANSARSLIQWIPYFAPDRLQSLSWKGILRKGEMQVIEGSIESSTKSLLKVRFGTQTLDSMWLSKGMNQFKLSFPAFAQGRTESELVLGNVTLDTLKFFARPAENLTVRFILESPDFESRNLATWLGKNGHAVIYDAVLSKNKSGNLNINKATEPDLLITDAGNVKNSSIKKAVLAAKSVLLMNLTNPAAEISSINATLGTRFQVKKISNENAVTVSQQLTALPYSFLAANHILNVPKIPVAIEKTTGKIGVSLLNETFPLQLAGDSLHYQNIWNTVLAFVRPSGKSNLEIQAPVIRGVSTALEMNGLPARPKFTRIGKDTAFLNYSAMNVQSAEAVFSPQESGWVTLPGYDDTEIYVENNFSLQYAFTMRALIRSSDFYHHKLSETSGNQKNPINGVPKKLPDWAWFAWVVICLAAVWIESKLS